MIKEEDMNGPCPQCGKTTLKMTNTRYSDPISFTAACQNCNFSDEGTGNFKTISTEELIRDYPEMYFGKLAERNDKISS